MLDVDGTFSFNVGNFCPDLFILNCLDPSPVEQVILPPPDPLLAGTQCKVRFRDGDSTCGAGCDPQTCVPNGNVGLTCTPGPDPGLSTTVTCTNAWLDCDGDGIEDPSCTWSGDTLGTLGQGRVDYPGALPAGTFFLACLPPGLGGSPGSVATCTAVTTDGDEDCNKQKVVSINCFSEDYCPQFAANEGFVNADAACQARAGTACVESVCDENLRDHTDLRLPPYRQLRRSRRMHCLRMRERSGLR